MRERTSLEVYPMPELGRRFIAKIARYTDGIHLSFVWAVGQQDAHYEETVFSHWLATPSITDKEMIISALKAWRTGLSRRLDAIERIIETEAQT